MWAIVLLGQAREDPLRRPEVIWGTAGIAVALLAGAVAIWAVDRWRKRAAAGRDAAEELTDFRGMYDRGEITAAEYTRLRDKVAGRMRGAGAAADPDKPPAPPPGPGDAAPPA